MFKFRCKVCVCVYVHSYIPSTPTNFMTTDHNNYDKTKKYINKSPKPLGWPFVSHFPVTLKLLRPALDTPCKSWYLQTMGSKNDVVVEGTEEVSGSHHAHLSPPFRTSSKSFVTIHITSEDRESLCNHRKVYRPAIPAGTQPLRFPGWAGHLPQRHPA